MTVRPVQVNAIKKIFGQLSEEADPFSRGSSWPDCPKVKSNHQQFASDYLVLPHQCHAQIRNRVKKRGQFTLADAGKLLD